MHACLGSARHQFIASEHRSFPLVFHWEGAPATPVAAIEGTTTRRGAERVTNPRSPWAGYSDHPQRDVSQGPGAVSGLQSQGVPRAVIVTVAG